MKKKIYLAGSIQSVSWEAGQDWRKEAAKLLSDKFEVVTPYRDREEKETLPDLKAAVVRDKMFIRECGVVLVNDTSPKPSIGTSMEILYAFEHGVPVIVFGNANNENAWLNYHLTLRYDTLAEACQGCNDLFY